MTQTAFYTIWALQEESMREPLIYHFPHSQDDSEEDIASRVAAVILNIYESLPQDQKRLYQYFPSYAFGPELAMVGILQNYRIKIAINTLIDGREIEERIPIDDILPSILLPHIKEIYQTRLEEKNSSPRTIEDLYEDILSICNDGIDEMISGYLEDHINSYLINEGEEGQGYPIDNHISWSREDLINALNLHLEQNFKLIRVG